jgi:S-adenosylmethionine:tRNA ribosyltransferase-isomerase
MNAVATPPLAIADAPPEERGLRRDAVRLLVASRSTGEITDTVFTRLPGFFTPGDVLVVNTSATLPAAVPTTDGHVVHFSTPVPKRPERWIVELREPCGVGTVPFSDARAGDRIVLRGGGTLRLLAPYPHDGPPRLWAAEPRLPGRVPAYLERHGRPVRYGCADRAFPIDAYQTVFARVPGSAEMPSAARPFTPEVTAALRRRGIDVVSITLHCGVSSQEAGEPPYAEWFRVRRTTAERVNAARAAGRSVIAVGTTVTRALETASAPDGRVEPRRGWTDLVITPERGVRAVDGLLTGWHEPEASHLQLIEAVGGRDLIERSYAAAADLGYLAHEFGDVHLITP